MRPLTLAERELLAWLDAQSPFLPDCVTHEPVPIGPAGVRFVPRTSTPDRIPTKATSP